jgi:tungstate transport system substrate-binding protein
LKVKGSLCLLTVVLVGIAATVWAGCASPKTRVVVAAGTTLVDGRMLEKVIADYESEHPGAVLSVVGAPTARVLALARAGSADVTITHDPELEDRFLSEDGAEVVADVFASRFLLAGPPAMARGLGGMNAADAFRRIADNGYLFVSRSDGSGTYQRERSIWDQAGIDPTGEAWYTRTGQGMGLTLQVASQRQAFVLVEWSVWLAAKETSELVDTEIQPVGLENPYRAMAVKDSPARDVSVDFVLWLQSPEGRESVRDANRELYGFAVFTPLTLP